MGKPFNNDHFTLTKGLPEAFEERIMPLDNLKRGVVMPQEKESLTPEERAAVLDMSGHPEGGVSLWSKAGALAAEKAREENARLGLNSPCSLNGQTGFRLPNGKFIAKAFDPH